jgi:hypothetical protein
MKTRRWIAAFVLAAVMAAVVFLLIPTGTREPSAPPAPVGDRAAHIAAPGRMPSPAPGTASAIATSRGNVLKVLQKRVDVKRVTVSSM